MTARRSVPPIMARPSTASRSILTENLWGTHVMADRVFALTPQGELRILLDDAPPDASKRLMEAFYKGQLTPDDLDARVWRTDRAMDGEPHVLWPGSPTGRDRILAGNPTGRL